MFINFWAIKIQEAWLFIYSLAGKDNMPEIPDRLKWIFSPNNLAYLI